MQRLDFRVQDQAVQDQATPATTRTSNQLTNTGIRYERLTF